MPRSPTHLTLVLLLLLSLAGRGLAQQLSPAHAAAIRDSVATMLAAFRRYSGAGQYDSLLALYDDGPSFRWVEGGVIRYQSAAQLRQAFAQVPATLRIQTVHEGTEIEPLGPGLASVVTQFRTTFADSTGRGASFGGVITMLVGHAAGGWRILVGHASTPPRQ